jgi:hypothetical protein
MDTSAGSKYTSDDEESGSKAAYKGSPGVGAAGGRYVADVGEPKGYQFSVNKNPINVERYQQLLCL